MLMSIIYHSHNPLLQSVCRSFQMAALPMVRAKLVLRQLFAVAEDQLDSAVDPNAAASNSACQQRHDPASAPRRMQDSNKSLLSYHRDRPH